MPPPSLTISPIRSAAGQDTTVIYQKLQRRGSSTGFCDKAYSDLMLGGEAVVFEEVGVLGERNQPLGLPGCTDEPEFAAHELDTAPLVVADLGAWAEMVRREGIEPSTY